MSVESVALPAPWQRAGLKQACAVLLACLAILAPPAPAADSAGPFLRFIPGAGEFEGRLEAAVTTYRNAAGVEIDLVAAVHIGDGDYYRQLGLYFESRDAVLYELVADAEDRPDGSRASGDASLLGWLQSGMSSMLGLQFQLDSIDYRRANFVHADLEPGELAALMQAKGENLLSAFLALVTAELANPEQAQQLGRSRLAQLSFAELWRLLSSPARQQVLRYLLGESLALTGGSLAAPAPGSPPLTLLDDRNRAALDGLRATLSRSDMGLISVFFGAAHMPGLEAGVLDLGFEPHQQRWLTVWQAP